MKKCLILCLLAITMSIMPTYAANLKTHAFGLGITRNYVQAFDGRNNIYSVDLLLPSDKNFMFEIGIASKDFTNYGTKFASIDANGDPVFNDAIDKLEYDLVKLGFGYRIFYKGFFVGPYVGGNFAFGGFTSLTTNCPMNSEDVSGPSLQYGGIVGYMDRNIGLQTKITNGTIGVTLLIPFNK